MKLRTLLSIVLCSAVAIGAHAQSDFPQRPVRLVVPYAAGGPTDILARTLAEDMSRHLSQPVIVDNRPGASGLLATRVVAKSPADGYTVLFTSLGHTVNPLLFKEPGYHPVRDFAPISLVTSSPAVLVVGANQPFRSVEDLLEAARKPGSRVSFGSSGVGGSAHLTGELLRAQSKGASLQHVPYKGNGPAIQDLMGGQTTFMFYPASTVAELLATKKIRALATTFAQRDASLPDVPTMKELGFADFENSHPWVGGFAPAGTPPDIVAKLSTAMQQSVQAGKLREALIRSGSTTIGSTPEEFARFVASDVSRWRLIVEAAGIKPE